MPLQPGHANAGGGAAPKAEPGLPLGQVAQPPRPRIAAQASGSARGLLPPLPGGAAPQTQMPHVPAGISAKPPQQAQQGKLPTGAGSSMAAAPSSQLPAAGVPAAQAAPRHRTLLNYALTVFPSRLAQLAPLGMRLRSGSACGGDVGQGQAAVLLPAESLQQLQTVAAAVQDALVKAGACVGGGGGGAGGTAALTVADREDVWRLSAACWEAAVAAAASTPPPDTPARAEEQSKLLHGLGSAIHEVALDPAAGFGAVAGGCGGCSGVRLLQRVRFLHQMGRAWLALGRCAPAGWFLVRAREGLGQLQAEAAEARPAPEQPQQRLRIKRARLSAPPHQDASDGSGAGVEAEGVGEVGHPDAAEEGACGGAGTSQTGAGGDGGGPWLALGLGCEEYLQVESDVLVESLRLALAEGQQALSANLRSQLRRLATSPHTPPGLAATSALTCMAILTDAAAIRLGAGAVDGASGGLGVASAPPQGGSSGNQLQPQAQGDAMALLGDALDVVEAAAEAEARRPAGAGRDEAAVERAAALVEARQQVLRFLISSCLRTASYQAALSYVRAFAESTAPAAAAGEGVASAGNAETVTAAEAAAAPPPLLAAAGTRAEADLPLDVLLLSVQAHVGLGRMVEAAALVAARVQPHPACTPAVMKAALSRLLGGASLPQLSASMPHLTACLLASLERCGRQDDAAVANLHHNGAAAQPGDAVLVGAGAWNAAAGGELVVLVSSALCAHEGRTAEQLLLALLALDDVVAAVCNSGSGSGGAGGGADGGSGTRGSARARLFGMLYARAAAAFQESDYEGAARLFAAALLYASGGGGAPYCRTARMLSACYAAAGQPDRALGYLDLAEAVEPHTAAHVLLRLRLVLALQQAEARTGPAAAGESGGAAPRHGGAGAGAAAETQGGAGGGDAAPGLGDGAAGGARAAGDGEVVQLVQRLPRCCDFELSHLAVAYDVAMRAQRFGVAVTATELAMRYLGPPPRQAATLIITGAAATAAAGALHAAIALARDCIAGRLAAVAAASSQGASVSRSGSRRAFAAPPSADSGAPLPLAAAAAVLRDLLWLCSRLSDAAAAPLTAQAQASLSWLRDVAVRLGHDALNGGRGLQPPAESQWRAAAAALRAAQQLDSALLLQGATASTATAPQQQGLLLGRREALRQQAAGSDAAQRQLQPVMVAVAAGMLATYATHAQASAAPGPNWGPSSALACAAAAARGVGVGSLPPPDMALVVEAQQLLEGCRCAGSGHCAPEAEPVAASPAASAAAASRGGGGAAMRGAVLQLRFVAATLAQDEAEQRALLQALVDEPAVCGRRMEALASLCLAPDTPWRCIRPGCALLSFCIRKGLPLPLPRPPAPVLRHALGGAVSSDVPSAGADYAPSAAMDVELVARAVRRLYAEGSSDLRVIVCKRAIEIATQLCSAHHDHVDDTGPATQDAVTAERAATTDMRVACRYPRVELHFLWAACLNAAVAAELSASALGMIASRDGAAGAPLLLDLASGLLRQLEDGGAEGGAAASGGGGSGGHQGSGASSLRTMWLGIFRSVSKQPRGHSGNSPAPAAAAASAAAGNIAAGRRTDPPPQLALPASSPATLPLAVQTPAPGLPAALPSQSHQQLAPPQPAESQLPVLHPSEQPQELRRQGSERGGDAPLGAAPQSHSQLLEQTDEVIGLEVQTGHPTVAPGPMQQQPQAVLPSSSQGVQSLGAFTRTEGVDAPEAMAAEAVRGEQATGTAHPQQPEQPPDMESDKRAGADPLPARVPALPCSDGAATDAAAAEPTGSGTAVAGATAAPVAGAVYAADMGSRQRRHHASFPPDMCDVEAWRSPGAASGGNAAAAGTAESATQLGRYAAAAASLQPPAWTLEGTAPDVPVQQGRASLGHALDTPAGISIVPKGAQPTVGAVRLALAPSPRAPPLRKPDAAMSPRRAQTTAGSAHASGSKQEAAVQQSLATAGSQTSLLSECYGGQPDPALASLMPPHGRITPGGGDRGLGNAGAGRTCRGGGVGGWLGSVLPMLPEGWRDATQLDADADIAGVQNATAASEQASAEAAATSQVCTLAAPPAVKVAPSPGVDLPCGRHAPGAVARTPPPSHPTASCPAMHPKQQESGAQGNAGMSQQGPAAQVDGAEGLVAGDEDGEGEELSPLPEQADPLERRSPEAVVLLARQSPPAMPLLQPGSPSACSAVARGPSALPASQRGQPVQLGQSPRKADAIRAGEAEQTSPLASERMSVADTAAAAAGAGTTAPAGTGTIAPAPVQPEHSPSSAGAPNAANAAAPAAGEVGQGAVAAPAAPKPAAARPRLSDSDINLEELDTCVAADEVAAAVLPRDADGPTTAPAAEHISQGQGSLGVPAGAVQAGLVQHAVAPSDGGHGSAKRAEGPTGAAEERAAKRIRTDAVVGSCSAAPPPFHEIRAMERLSVGVGSDGAAPVPLLVGMGTEYADEADALMLEDW
ncbi:hypothetical protein HYH02_010370 [Chlamydomonas schloesseri]|uniref:Uncharacterized protein n=1 Tax=Chlamydomonas schloesseri TaxID=2026947 RepID=A0A835TAI5_9CHLO|nr:hypothetical protein HYH02_010370 [Chlamydomonas schloesseri]|eukprot:KAG2440491.1 hypothetical protein HYH02_010370 [Chlamydomonas schloesseri]